MDIVSVVVNAVSGLVGGNAMGAAWKDKSLGAIGNSIAGVVGGVLGGVILNIVQLLNNLGLAEMTVESLGKEIGAAGIGGGILTAIVGMIKKWSEERNKGK